MRHSLEQGDGRSGVGVIDDRARAKTSRMRVKRAALSFMAGAGLCLGGAPIVATASAHGASAARTVSLSEFGKLRLTSKQGFTLNERGSATGTIAGTIYIHLHIVSNSKVTAEVNIYPTSGSLTGNGSAAYHVNGGQAVFTGTLAIGRGTGKYARARASRLTFIGAIERRNDAVSVQLSGRLSL